MNPIVAKVEDAVDAPAAGSPLRYDKASLRLAQGEAVVGYAEPLTTQLARSRVNGEMRHTRLSRRVRNMALFPRFLDVTNSEFHNIAQNALKH